MKKNKSKTKNKNIFYKIISILLIISSFTFLGFLFYIDLLPTKYLILILFGVLFFDLINIFLLNLKRLKKKIKKIISVFVIIAILITTIANFYIGKTLGVLIGNGDSKYKLENYSVIVLKDSSYKRIKDLDGKVVGYFENSEGFDEANKRIEKEVKVDFKSYKTSDTLVQDLLDSKVDAIVIEDSIKNIMKEELQDFSSLTKVIYTFSVKIEVETTLKEVNVTKEPFAIYISGIDTYGEISSVSRSDVNMVMLVNPKINQILLISIPRDYYVQLHGTTGTKDKLTHAGIYGINMSIQTIEDLLELDINYYLKVNFTSVIDIVNALGGLDVYSEYTFTSYSGYKFKKGMNSVNGEQALDFARTRKAFVDGDRQRGKNQQAIIESIIRKATDKSIITKYSSLLNAIDGKYQTNMSIKKITSIIKMQLAEMPNWTVTSYSLSGKDSKKYTYTYNQLLYVMEPDENSVKEAIQLINNVLSNQQLENSYNDLGGYSNKVTQVQVNNSSTTTNQSTNNKKNDKVKEEKVEISEELEEDENITENGSDQTNNEVDQDVDDNTSDNSSDYDTEDNEVSEDENLDIIIPSPEN